MQKQGRSFQTVIVALLLAAGGGVMAGDGKSSPETDLAAPGAPLYEKAVTESVTTLMSKQEQAKLGAANRPPSPGPDYYWCENCKTYHKRKTPSARKPAVAPRSGTAPASVAQTNTVTAARPPSPGPDYYWCTHCKTYHKKKSPSAAAQTNTVAAVRPPSPGPDYYWCTHCKTYHKRKVPTPVQAHTPPPAAGAAQSPGPNYYYCEKCKTYHLRQSMDQHSVEKLIVGGTTNGPNPSLLTTP